MFKYWDRLCTNFRSGYNEGEIEEFALGVKIRSSPYCRGMFRNFNTFSSSPSLTQPEEFLSEGCACKKKSILPTKFTWD